MLLWLEEMDFVPCRPRRQELVSIFIHLLSYSMSDLLYVYLSIFVAVFSVCLSFSFTHSNKHAPYCTHIRTKINAKAAQLHAAHRWCVHGILSKWQLKKAIINSFWQQQPVLRLTIRYTTLNHIAIFYTLSVCPALPCDCSKGCKVLVVSWHVPCGHAKSCRFMYTGVWLRVTHEEQNVLHCQI